MRNTNKEKQSFHKGTKSYVASSRWGKTMFKNKVLKSLRSYQPFTNNFCNTHYFTKIKKGKAQSLYLDI